MASPGKKPWDVKGDPGAWVSATGAWMPPAVVTSSDQSATSSAQVGPPSNHMLPPPAHALLPSAHVVPPPPAQVAPAPSHMYPYPAPVQSAHVAPLPAPPLTWGVPPSAHAAPPPSQFGYAGAFQAPPVPSAHMAPPPNHVRPSSAHAGDPRGQGDPAGWHRPGPSSGHAAEALAHAQVVMPPSHAAPNVVEHAVHTASASMSSRVVEPPPHVAPPQAPDRRGAEPSFSTPPRPPSGRADETRAQAWDQGGRRPLGSQDDAFAFRPSAGSASTPPPPSPSHVEPPQSPSHHPSMPPPAPSHHSPMPPPPSRHVEPPPSPGQHSSMSVSPRHIEPPMRPPASESTQSSPPMPPPSARHVEPPPRVVLPPAGGCGVEPPPAFIEAPPGNNWFAEVFGNSPSHSSGHAAPPPPSQQPQHVGPPQNVAPPPQSQHPQHVAPPQNVAPPPSQNPGSVVPPPPPAPVRPARNMSSPDDKDKWSSDKGSWRDDTWRDDGGWHQKDGSRRDGERDDDRSWRDSRSDRGGRDDREWKDDSRWKDSKDRGTSWDEPKRDSWERGNSWKDGKEDAGWRDKKESSWRDEGGRREEGKKGGGKDSSWRDDGGRREDGRKGGGGHVAPPPAHEGGRREEGRKGGGGHVVPPPAHAPGNLVPPPVAGQLTVLMVAEKPSIAETIASALSSSSSTKRSGVAPRSAVHEFTGKFRGESAHFRVTATFGHIYNLAFDKDHSDREGDPGQLFAAPVVKNYDWKSKMPEHIAAEAKGCQAIVLWLDCDREGENICFEVMGNALPVMDTSRTFSGAHQDRVFRAKFSSLSPADLQRAMANLSVPNENQAHSVDARQEIDLRLGIAFSRFLTQYFHKTFGDAMIKTMPDVTYGPCQMPTLWFCVHRHCQIEAFIPKSFWRVRTHLRRDQLEFSAELTRDKVWDEDEAKELLGRLQKVREARITSIARQRVILQRPLPLNTVAMLRQASERAGLSPADAMHHAEQLYLRGILSYPRTETSRYPSSFDLKAVLWNLQTPGAPWATAADRISKAFTEPRQDGDDHGDHPPITPVRWATDRQCGDSGAWALYELVCRHFLATISPDCVLNETRVSLDMAGVSLLGLSSRRINDANSLDWCEAMGAKVDEQGDVDLGTLTQDSVCSVSSSSLCQEATKPPSYLSESDLLGLMEKHCIGTDASMATHIANILKRGYAKVTPSGRQRLLEPTGMGLALSHAYTLVDPGLVRPTVRSSIENACARVARGQAKKEDVISNAVSIFERKFRHFVNRVDRVPAMLSVAYKRETASAAAQWQVAAKATADVSLDDLLKSRDSIEIGGEEAAPAPSAGSLRPGLVVHIHGLKGAAELNGQKGTCEHRDTATGRWHVRLASGVTKALKPDNLQISSQSPENLKEGASVRLHSLKGAPHLNNQLGTCESFDAAAGRWTVKLQSGEARALKPENLSWVDDGAKAAVKRPRAEEAEIEIEPAAKRAQVEQAERETVKKRVFSKCDKDGDGYLNKDEMQPLGQLSGLDASADKWRVEFMKLCIGVMANTTKGIPEKGVLELLDDISEDGCYCSDEQLNAFLRTPQA